MEAIGRSTFAVFGDAPARISSLSSTEVRLARTEVAEAIAGLIAAMAVIAGAAVFAVVALLVLIQGLVALLVEHGWRVSTGSFTVEAGIPFIAAAAALLARSKLAASRLVPSRSVAQARDTVELMRGRRG